MLVKRIAACSLPIYLQPFTCYSEIIIGRKLQLFSYPLHLTLRSVGVFPLEFRGKVWSSES